MGKIRAGHYQVQSVELFLVVSYHSGAGCVHDEIDLIFRVRMDRVAELFVGTIEYYKQIILGNRNDFLQNLIHSYKLVLLQIYVII